MYRKIIENVLCCEALVVNKYKNDQSCSVYFPLSSNFSMIFAIGVFKEEMAGQIAVKNKNDQQNCNR